MILIAEVMHPHLMDTLEAHEIPFHYLPDLTLAQLPNEIANYDGLVVRSKFQVGKNLLDCAPQLRFIARAGSGMDNIDEEYARQLGIELIHAPEALCDSVAEHTIGMILALQHKLISGNNEIKKQQWNREANRGLELMNATLGIIGYGHTGSAVARKISGFGVKVLAYDKYKKAEEAANGSFFFNEHATSCDLNTIYQQSDILTLHVPLTTETKAWVNKKFFDQFKKPIVFINCSRGKIVNTADLADAIRAGRIRGAALDVLEEEPPFANNQKGEGWFSALTAMENVILTPHVAGWSVQSYQRISDVLSRKIIDFLNREKI